CRAPRNRVRRACRWLSRSWTLLPGDILPGSGLELIRRHQHFGGHPRHVRPFGIVEAHLEHDGFDVALAPVHVALRGEVGLGALEEDFSGGDGATREPHAQRIAEAYMVGLRFWNGRAHPGVGQVDNGHDRLVDVEHFALAGGAYRHGSRYWSVDLRVAEAHLGLLLLFLGVREICEG